MPPITARLMTTLGLLRDEFTDYSGLLFEILKGEKSQSLELMGYIDEEGLTVFNHLQMESLLRDITSLKERVNTPTEREILAKIERFSTRCADNRGLVLQFLAITESDPRHSH